MKTQRTVLGIFAHPDDEILGPGGTFAKLTDHGTRVVLVCATRGEAGQIAVPELATPDRLGEVREQEMGCSAEELGVSQVYFLDYRDSGMAGTPENEHPEAFIKAPPEEVVAKLVAIIREVQPDAVVTFEPYGGYGHPDHIAIHHHTLAAYEAAAMPGRLPDAGAPWQPKRLLYTLLPTFFFEEMRDRIARYGGKVDDFDFTERLEKGWPDDQIHVFTDVSEYVDAKMAAWNCHRTQFGPDSRFRRLPQEEMAALLSREYFAIARPAPVNGLHLSDPLEAL